ncbi:MAG: chromosome segregation protein SMC [Gammaproteobacteria bacterium]|nr:chromosome segregation protein SMC [Gammaproteobacteria bacterium]
MRLSKIKISGFKSFVDPTTLLLPGNLTGIVGPNGCGKSNIIDAINWVMGESSAKHLRGDSLADVIFNGSNSRKPIGQATVEILFDNSDGQIGGQYAAYAEISIKRVLSRDGVSTYLLNGTRCRRRDITDLFLGTGVGSRSYSVIEQGMISRVVEAKPDELRTFLEEAAGISKYKERRRETENRMRHTRENLERLNDIRDELARQLTHLERQSKAAEKYKELKVEERRLKSSLLAVRWRDLAVEADSHGRSLQHKETDVEHATAQVRAIEAAITKLREEQVAATEDFNRVQAAFYGVGAEISRLEQSIRHAEERREQLQRDLAQARVDADETQSHLVNDEQSIRDIGARIDAVQPDVVQAETDEREAYEAFESCEQSMQGWQQIWDQFNSSAGEAMRAQRVQEARIEHLQHTERDATVRVQTLRGELERLQPQTLVDEITRIERELGSAVAAFEQLTRREEHRQQQEREFRARIDSLGADLDDTREQRQELGTRIASLDALQKAAMTGDLASLGAWLEERGLAGADRLAQRIEVQPGWEMALEAAIRVPLDTLCVSTLDGVIDAPRPRGRITLLDTRAAPVAAAQWTPVAGRALQELVRSPWPLGELLAGVYVAEDAAAAALVRGDLRDGECVVTRDGGVYGRGWVRLPSSTAGEQSVLARERELQQCKGQARALDDRISELVAAITALREQVQALQADAGHGGIREAQERVVGLRAALAGKRAQHEHVTGRIAHIEADLADLEDQIALDAEQLDAARRQLTGTRGTTSTLEQERAQLEAQREALRAELQRAREHWRAARDRMHSVSVQMESMKSQTGALDHALDRHRSVLQQLRARCEELERGLTAAAEPLAQLRRDLEVRLGERVRVEGRLGDARHALERTEGALREREQGRLKLDEALQEQRELLERLRVEARGLQVRMQDLAEQLGANGFEPEALAAELPEGLSEQSCRADIETIDKRIARLGPINLAAIDEFAELNERKSYLDNQHADLTEALATLEDAIRRIDRETRTRFKETFDKVNSGLQQIFPVLFGGGHAYLELTGTDLLETGVAVMARPPGKRNSTIHLLSGGEKALTALALVMSIFELNPAPFCLLDEVDAPLDDANVYRYCDLLKSMAGRVQFIFVTHNKITMEIAELLIGVTMHEPGVSRLVAVNMDEAVQMAASA